MAQNAKILKYLKYASAICDQKRKEWLVIFYTNSDETVW